MTMHRHHLYLACTKRLRAWLVPGLVVCAVAVHAATPVIDLDQADIPSAPAFSTSQLLPIEMPSYVSLKFGVDPATLTITSDGIVRYVMVAVNASGSVNAMFEGIRCATGEVQTYARTNASGAWANVKEPQWHNLTDNLPSKHALALATQGACDGRSAPASSTAIIKALKKQTRL